MAVGEREREREGDGRLLWLHHLEIDIFSEPYFFYGRFDTELVLQPRGNLARSQLMCLQTDCFLTDFADWPLGSKTFSLLYNFLRSTCCILLYNCTYTYTNICTNNQPVMNEFNNEQMHFFIKIYLSHFIFERVMFVMCEKWVDTRTDCYIHPKFFSQP